MARTKQNKKVHLSCKTSFSLFLERKKEKVSAGPASSLGSRVIPHTEEDAGGQKAAPFHLQRSVVQALPAGGMEHLNHPQSKENELEMHERPHPLFLPGAVSFVKRCTGEQGHYHHREVIQRAGILGCLIFGPGCG